MDASRLTGKIYKGYGAAAKHIGLNYTLYRPVDPLNALSNAIGNLKASFNAQDWKYIKPNLYGKAIWYGVFDARQTQVGDYLVGGPDGTFFIAGMQTHLSILCVSCNRVGKIQFQDSSDMDSNDLTTVVDNAPMSIMSASESKGKLDSHLEIGPGRYHCLLPSLGVYIGTNYIILDDLQQSYAVMSSELTDLGWRLMIERIRT
jgi:hypothetical protein